MVHDSPGFYEESVSLWEVRYSNGFQIVDTSVSSRCVGRYIMVGGKSLRQCLN